MRRHTVALLTGIVGMLLLTAGSAYTQDPDQSWSGKFPIPGLDSPGGFRKLALGSRGLYYCRVRLGFNGKGWEIPRRDGGWDEYMIAIWDGSSWTFEGPGTIEGSAFDAAAVEGTEVFFGGSFSSVGGVPARNIASLRGGVWGSVGPGVNGRVLSIAPTGNIDIYVGGEFTAAGDTALRRIGMWDGEKWHPLWDQGGLVNGTNGSVQDIAVGNAAIYVVGGFSTAGGTPVVGGIARWIPGVTQWAGVGGGIPNGVFNSIGTFGTDVYVGGQIVTSTTSTGHVGRFDGSAWTQAGSSLSSVQQLLVAPNGDLFTEGSSTGAWLDLSWLSGGTWQLVGGVTSLDVIDMLHTGSVLYVAYQSYSPAAGREPRGLAKWDGAGWDGLGMGVGNYWTNTDYVRAFAEYNGQLYAGGLFETAGPDSIRALARFDGSRWQPVGTGLPASWNSISALLQWNGRLYASGNFTTIGGTAANYIASWDGSGWSPVGTGLPGFAEALAVHNGQLYAGGSFQTFTLPLVRAILRWTGNSWTPLGEGVYGSVLALASGGSDLFVGGVFDQVDTLVGGLNHLARWDGSRWHRVGGGVAGVPSVVPITALAYSNGNLYVGGTFTAAGAVPANNIARWDGSQWHPLGSGTDGPVNAIVVNGSDVYVGGRFLTAGSDTVWGIARWDGAQWHPLGNGVHKNINFVALPTVRALYGSADGLYLGGDFTHAGRNYSNRIALWTDFTPVTSSPEESLPGEHRLLQNYPNPFNPETMIGYEVPVTGDVRLVVYDLLGREVAELVNETQAPGAYTVRFNAAGLASGIYFYRLASGSAVKTRKMLLMR